MWAVLLQVLAVAAGWQLVRQLPLTWRRLEALAASVAVGFAVVPWLYFVGVLLAGWRVAMPMVTVAAALATAASWFWLRPRAKLTSRRYMRPLGWRVVGWIVAGGVVFVVSNLVLLGYQFPGPTGAWASNGNMWGDAPLHVALTNQFSHGDKLDLISPVYERVLLTYPLIADLWSGVLMRLTSSWYLGLAMPSVAIILALLQLLFSFAYRLLGSARGAWLAWLMLVFSGSLQGGIKFANILVTQGYEAYKTAVGYSFSFSTGDNYLNFLHSHPMPQRAYSFGMPLALVVATVALELYRWRKSHTDRRKSPDDRRERLVGSVIAGGLLGLMPLVHTHSFMIMVGALGLATISLWWFERKLPYGWWQMLVVGLVLAVPQVIWQFSTTYHGGFSHWIWGWMMVNFEPVVQNWFVYWFHNIGWLFVMILGGWLLLYKTKARPEIWLVYVAGSLIFVICNLYAFQPSLWDNMKFFEYGFWMIMLASADVMVQWLKRWYGWVVTGLLMVTLCFTGFLTLVVTGPQLTFDELSAEEVQFGNQMRASLPDDAYILVGDRHNSPVTMLANRKVLMTFGGWYNLYGGDWPQTYQDRGLMLGGAENAQALIQHYGVNTAAFSDAEISSGEVNLAFFQSHYHLFYHGAGWWVFDLRQAS
ncbi:MAG TPA: hypothetical protein VI322_04140 [Candidatus Saccharimonadia bacterium]